MDHKITVLLAFSSRIHRLELQDLLTKDRDLQVVGATGNGRKALALIHELHPKILICDQCLPDLDALKLLRCFGEMDAPPKTIILSAFASDFIMAEAARRGAHYFMVRPLDEATLFEQIYAAMQLPYSVEPPAATALREMRLPSHEPAFAYLVASVTLARQEPDKLNAMMKEFYPEIAAQCGSTPGAVEKALRRAIAYIWANAEPEVLRKYFPVDQSNGHRPCNSHFIALLTEYLRS